MRERNRGTTPKPIDICEYSCVGIHGQPSGTVGAFRRQSVRDGEGVRRWRGLAFVAVAAAVVIAGCGNQAPKSTPAASPAAPPAANFGGTDLAWIEISIAIDEQLLPLLDLVPTHDAGPQVTALAAKTRAITETELPVLHSMHDQAKLPSQNPHEGMTMPGVISPDEIAKAKALSGAGFATYAQTKIDEALRQAVNLAGSEQRFGQEPRTRALAAKGASDRNSLLPKPAAPASPRPS
jgi:hypothetical protein